MFFGRHPSSLTTVAQAGRDRFRQCFVCMGENKNAAVVVAMTGIFWFVNHVDGCIFKLCGTAYSWYAWISVCLKNESCSSTVL